MITHLFFLFLQVRSVVPGQDTEVAFPHLFPGNYTTTLKSGTFLGPRAFPSGVVVVPLWRRQQVSRWSPLPCSAMPQYNLHLNHRGCSYGETTTEGRDHTQNHFAGNRRLHINSIVMMIGNNSLSDVIASHKQVTAGVARGVEAGVMFEENIKRKLKFVH